MNFWRWLGVSSLVVGLFLTGTLLPVFAQGDKKGSDELKPEDFTAFKADSKPFYQRITTTTIQKMTVEKQQVTQTQKQTFYLLWTPQKSDDKDAYKVQQQIVGVNMEIMIGSNKINYDSADANATNPMGDFFKALKEAKLTFVVDSKTLKITKVEGRDEFIKKLGDSAPQMKNLLSNILSDEAIKQMAQPCWGAIPTKAVKKGDSWPEKEEKGTLNLGAIGSYQTIFKYSLEKSDGKTDTIKITPKMEYAAPATMDAKDQQLPFKIKKDGTALGSVDGADTTGEAVFDRATGRIASSTMKLKLAGKLNIDVGGTETLVELNQDQTSVMGEPTPDEIKKYGGTSK